MKKKTYILLTVIITVIASLLWLPVQAEEKKVFFKGEIPDFSEDTAVMDLYVAPLMSADSMLLKIGDKTMLIDSGTTSGYRDVLQMLQDLNVTRLDYFFNTHPHDDHLGGIQGLLKSIEIGEVLTRFPADYKQIPLQKNIMKRILDAGIPVTEIGNRTEMEFAGAHLTFFWHENIKDTLNNRSCMLNIRFGNCTLLLTADVENNAVQDKLVSEFPDLMKADVLKYPHHGLSKASLNFIDAVDPEIAFINTGFYDSKNGQKTLNKRDIPYTFSTWGVIHFSTDGNCWITEHLLKEQSVNNPERFGTLF